MFIKLDNYLRSKNEQAGHFINENQTNYHFQIDNIDFLLYYDQKTNPNYFRITIPFYDEGTELSTIYEKCTQTTSKFILGKTVLLNTEEGKSFVMISVEQLFDENYSPAFERMILILKEMYKYYQNYGKTTE